MSALDNLKSKLPLNKDKLLNTVTISLFVLGALCVLYVILSNYLKKRETAKIGNMDCVKETKLIAVGDEHMEGLFSKGSQVSVLDNFYNCNDVKRGEYALYRFSPQIDPVVRTVQGVPGDRYSLTEDTAQKGSWKISINGEPVKVNGQDYYIQSNTVPPLKTYELSRGGVLGADEYILLSNVPPGLSDSSNLGLINKKDLVGKVKAK